MGSRIFRASSRIVSVVCLLSLGLTWSPGGPTQPAQAVGNAPGQPSRLRTEYMQNPLGIDVAAPRFSWVGSDIDRGDGQSKYQVRVARSVAELTAGVLVWDSGTVSSSNSTQVVYGGPALISRSAYAWDAKIWDRAGNASARSAPASFEMGLLQSSDWSAAYITAPLQYARTTFAPDAGKTVTKARAYVAAYNPLSTVKYTTSGGPNAFGSYELWLNGAKVPTGLFEPNWTNADKRVLYRTYDVTSMLVGGTNVVGLMMSNPRVMVQLEITYSDGTQSTVGTSATWRTKASPVTFSNFMTKELYDARLEVAWQSPTFDASAWGYATEATNPAPRLSAATVPMIGVSQVLQPTSITALGNDEYMVDYGNEYAAIPYVTVDGTAGKTVVLSYSETFDPATKTQYGQINQSDSFIAKGGTETFLLHFSYRSFRYMKVKLWVGASAPTTSSAVAYAVNTQLESAMSFASSNSLFNRIHQASRRTLLNNVHGHPEDCPHREKAGWGADANAASEPMLYNFDSVAFYTKWLNDLADSQYADGGIPSVVGLYSGEAGWVDPAWATVYPMLAWNLYRYTGDTRVLAQHYDGIKKLVDYLTTRATNGILDKPAKNWGQDWATALGPISYRIFDTGYYYADASIVAQIAHLLGKSSDEATYTTLAGTIRTAFNSNFYNATTHAYAGGGYNGVGTNAIPLQLGLVPAGDEAAVATTLVNQVLANGGKLPAGVVGNQFIQRALVKAGRSDLVGAWLNQTTAPSYGYMLNNGPGTIWEYWNIPGYDNGLSRNHPAFTATTVWLYETLAGIRQTDASVGFDHPLIAPIIDPTTTFVNATKSTPYGDIVSNWNTTTPGFSFVESTTIPFNTDATVQIPISGVVNPTITEGSTVLYANGAFAWRPAGVAGVGATGSSVTFSVGSGSYNFKVRAGDTPGRVDDASPAITYQNFEVFIGLADWYAVNGTVHTGRTVSKGSFTCASCTGFGLVASTGPHRGIIRVSIDGGPPIDIDTYRSTWSQKQSVWSSADLARGPHTIAFGSGGSNPLSPVPTFELDAIDVRT